MMITWKDVIGNEAKQIDDEPDLRRCPTCEKEVPRSDMSFTHDCHGIPFRLVCQDCYMKLMADGYDGEFYTEADENIHDDY